MTKTQLKERLKQYAISVAKFILKLPFNTDQLSRSSSSSAANYSAALRAKSPADFLNKFKIVEEELDESIFFFEFIEAMNPSFKNEIGQLSKEGNELLSIIVSSLKTLRAKHFKNR